MQRSPPLSSGVPENVGAREVDHPCVDAHERGGALAVVGAASALAKGTAGVEPAGKAEIPTAAKLGALVLWAQGEPGREVDSLPQGDKVMYEPPPEALPPEGWRNHEPSSQKGKRKQEALPQKREFESARTRARCEPEVKALPQDGRMVDTLPQKDEDQFTKAQTQKEHTFDAPPQKGKHKRGATPQGSPNEGELLPDLAPQEPSREDDLHHHEK